jgi:hypothetical protein
MTGAAQLAVVASWIATAIGLGLWLWGWFGTRAPLKRQRMHDCGVVLVFSAILVRVVTRASPLSAWEWALLFIGPLFIAAALWRLARTQ